MARKWVIEFRKWARDNARHVVQREIETNRSIRTHSALMTPERHVVLSVGAGIMRAELRLRLLKGLG